MLFQVLTVAPSHRSCRHWPCHWLYCQPSFRLFSYMTLLAAARSRPDNAEMVSMSYHKVPPKIYAKCYGFAKAVEQVYCKEDSCK